MSRHNATAPLINDRTHTKLNRINVTYVTFLVSKALECGFRGYASRFYALLNTPFTYLSTIHPLHLNTIDHVTLPHTLIAPPPLTYPRIAVNLVSTAQAANVKTATLFKDTMMKTTMNLSDLGINNDGDTLVLALPNGRFVTLSACISFLLIDDRETPTADSDVGLCIDNVFPKTGAQS